MKVLRHSVSGRLFEATPALLKHNKMVPATDEEAAEFLRGFAPAALEAAQKHTVKILIPEDFDLDTDTSTFGKVQLLEVASKLKLLFPETIKTKDLKVLVEQALKEARRLRDEAAKAKADAEAVE
ncbi:MAG: hypothetical protein HPY82_05725 [Gammaproteobacteria bacterium]|nr:hypothetical protein [Gammaproteobacteria bacterium]